MKKSGLTVLTNPHPELRRVSSIVSAKDLASPETQAFIDQLETAMIEYDGVGIAAPQVGVKKRIIIVKMDGHVTAFVNPEIISTSFRTSLSEEGCLSVPGVFGLVKRNRHAKVKTQSRDGKEMILDTKDLTAYVFQHEIDHLNGVLFIDKVEKYL